MFKKTLGSLTALMTIFWIVGYFAEPLRAAEEALAPRGSLESSVVERSLVSAGDTTRLEHVLAKARRGEPIVVGVIGGSITAGARASRVDRRWGDLVAKWWRERFPKTDVQFVNAGIGATGSDIGAHRAAKHLISHRPDLVVVEYAVNDGGSKIASETLEGLVRQILKQPNQPAVMLLFMMNKNGQNVQDMHIPVGRHYGLTMVSYRDAFWPEIEAGRLVWEDIGADEVHPNDRGHQYAADLVTSAIEKVLADLPSDAELAEAPSLPGPKISDVFEHVRMLNADDIAPVVNRGWERLDDHVYALLFGPGWQTETPGSVLEFEVEASAVSIMFWRIKGAMGIAEARVDDGLAVKCDAWFGADWGGYTPLQLVARDLKPGPHRLVITLLDKKNKASTGHEFRLHAIMLAGVKDRQDRQNAR